MLGGTTTLGASLTDAGAFTLNQQFATLALNGKTLTLTGTTNFASGAIRSANGQQDKLLITGAAVDLSAVSVRRREATDVISITGTGAGNTLIGSSKNDAPVAGARRPADQRVGARCAGGTEIDTASYALRPAAGGEGEPHHQCQHRRRRRGRQPTTIET